MEEKKLTDIKELLSTKGVKHSTQFVQDSLEFAFSVQPLSYPIRGLIIDILNLSLTQSINIPTDRAVRALWDAFALSSVYQPLAYKVSSALAALLRYEASFPSESVHSKPSVAIWELIKDDATFSKKRTLLFLAEILPLLPPDLIIERYGRIGLWNMSLKNLWRVDIVNVLSRAALTGLSVLSDVKDDELVDELQVCLLDERRLKSVSTYLLPQIAKIRSTLLDLVYTRLYSEIQDTDCLLAIISICKVSPAHTIPTSLLSHLLIHQSISIRTSAFTFLVSSPAIIAMDPDTIEMFKEFWTYSIGVEERSFRQEAVVQSLPLLLKRFRQTPPRSKHDTRIFILWLWDFTLRCCNPLSPFRVHLNALRIIEVILSSGIDPTYNNIKPLKPQERKWEVHLSLITKELVDTLIIHLLSTYTELRNISRNLLENLTSPLPGYNKESVHHLETEGRRMVRCAKESDARGGVAILGLVWSKGGQTDPYLMIRSLLSDVNDQIKVAERSIIEAAETGPIHGTITAISHILALIVKSTPSPDEIPIVESLIRECWDTGKRAWTAVRIILCDSAPEGMDVQDDYEDSSAGSREKKIVATAWRTMKSVGELVETIIVLPIQHDLQLKTIERLQETSDLFFTWLTTIRHSGAFSTLYPNFEKICQTLVRSSQSTRDIVSSWLNRSIDFILEDAASTTRRSGGIPYCILGPLTSFVGVQVRNNEATCFQASIQRLFKMAEDSTQTTSVRVNAYNSLRAIFQSSKCSTEISAFVERGFVLAFQGFWMNDWRFRNSSLLLYSAITARVFNKVRESRDNRLLLDDFFNRYPRLLFTLSEELDRAVEVNLNDFPTADLQSSLYSVLLLLTNLRTLRNDTPASNQSSQLIPAIEECAKSRVMKVREVSSVALACLLSPEESMKFCETLLTKIFCKTQNELHGRLLQIFRLMENVMEYHVQNRADDWISTLAHQFIPLFNELMSIEDCAPTVKLALLDILQLLPTNVIPKSTLDLLENETLKPAVTDNPGSSSLLSQIASVLLRIQDESRAIVLLNSHERPLMHSALRWYITQRESIEVDISTLEDIIRNSPIDILPSAVTALQYAHYAPSSSGILEDLKNIANSNLVTVQQAIIPTFSKLLRTSPKADYTDWLITFIENWNDPEQGEEFRLAAVMALENGHTFLFDGEFRLRAFKTLLRFMADDDPGIREIAERIAHTQIKVDGSCYVGDLIIQKLINLLPSETILEMIKNNSIGDKISTLREHNSVLFAVENPNMYQDQLAELLHCISVLKDRQVKPPTTSCFDDFETILREEESKVDSPLGLRRMPEFWEVALRWWFFCNPQSFQGCPWFEELKRVVGQ